MVLFAFGALFFSEEVFYCLEYSNVFPHDILFSPFLEEVIMQKGILKKKSRITKKFGKGF